MTEVPKTELIWLNSVNGADKVLYDYAGRLLEEFKAPLIGATMGIAYGGEIEAIGKLWKDRGTIYGYDTFEDQHPDHLSYDKTSREARCMDHWYMESIHGTKGLAYDHQRATLAECGLDNTFLIKGEVDKDSCKGIPYLNYCFLDMDLIESMRNGYAAVKDKFLPGSYLFIHDALPADHLPSLYKWFYEDVLVNDKKWEIIGEWPESHLTGVRRK